MTCPDDISGTYKVGPGHRQQNPGGDEWLPLIAAGQAVGITSEATANQNPRPGVAYRRVPDAPPIPVRLAWWKFDPPAHLDDLVELTYAAYRANQPGTRSTRPQLTAVFHQNIAGQCPMWILLAADDHR